MVGYFTRIYDEIAREKVKWAIIAVSVGVLALLVCYPIGILFWKSLFDQAGNFTLGNYVAIFADVGLFSALKNSLIVAVSSTLLSTFMALPIAFAVARTNMPLKNLVSAMVLVSFVIPSFIQAIAWILLLGPRSGLVNVVLRDTLHLPVTFNIFGMPGLVFVLSLNLYPFIYYNILASLNNIDPAYEEAARMTGAKARRTALGISFPLASPALVTGTILAFLHAVSAFGAPVAIALPARFHVLTTRIYQLFTFPPRLELAAACATPIVALTALGLVMQKVYLGRKQFHTITGKTGHPEPVDIGRSKYMLLAFSFLVILVAVFLPLSVLVRTSFTKVWGLPLTLKNFTLYNYRLIFDPTFYVLKSMENTFVLGIAASTICVILCVVIVWVIERGKVKGAGFLSFLCMITFAFPSTALAIGILLAFMVSPFNLQGTLSIILLGIGVYGLLTKRHLLKIFISVELIAIAATLNFVMLAGQQLGEAFLILAFSTDTAVSAVILALLVIVSKKYGTSDINEIVKMEREKENEVEID